MPIAGATLVPHPPIIIPTVGRGREAEVQNAIDACSRDSRFPPVGVHELDR